MFRDREIVGLERFSVSRRTFAFHLPEASSSSSSGFLGSLEGNFPRPRCTKTPFPLFPVCRLKGRESFRTQPRGGKQRDIRDD